MNADTGRDDAVKAADDLEALLAVLPPAVRKAVERESAAGELLEVVLDLGRPPEARFAGGDFYLSTDGVTQEDLAHVIAGVSPFGGDNRAGIARTLHRISAIRNRAGDVIGLTCRVGRAVRGSARVIEDFATSGASVLLVGRPGVGKTTILRELARVMADSAGKRVVIVDTSNEIAGDGDIPHPAIGRARRMQVATPEQQHAVMIEAVENHMPEVIIVDEMGTELEAAAARTIAERGVQLIATAHGNTLENLLVNPTLSDLVGGVHSVTLGDEEARRRRTQKTILERKAPPTFDVLVEIQSWSRVAVHAEVARTVDAVLRGQSVTAETRELEASGAVRRSFQTATTPPEFEVAPFVMAPARHSTQRAQHPGELPKPMGHEATPAGGNGAARPARVHPFGIGRERLEEAARQAGVSVTMASSVGDAEMVLTTKAHFRRGAPALREAEQQGTPVFVLRRNTPAQIAGFLQQIARDEAAAEADRPFGSGAAEAEQGVAQILTGDADTVELRPQSAFVRSVQHRIAERAKLRSASVGREPRRRVTIRRR